MSSDNVLLETGALLVAHTGILIGTVCLPFAVSFLLDGIVQILRGDGPQVFRSALALVVFFAGGGYLLWQSGISYAGADQEGPALMGTVALALLAFSTVMALVGFVVRTVKLLRNARRAEERLQHLQMSPQFRLTGRGPADSPRDDGQVSPILGDAQSAVGPWALHSK
ncbi:hypothetical protein E3O62_09265 [Cryobacterium sp. TMT2-15-1]|uniref:hypothetical protein n=1 Tax=Cryobacterium sp. TMT2-15-1 TaxID=1259246 RepID=UPI00106CAC92|nr:hypothetical protein [Cryobacterium sp. TMT2-15-1]TFC59574.1 hypothetical protein E3O62_09265 [Cryobacterium sp. TMT2-15-1]